MRGGGRGGQMGEETDDRAPPRSRDDFHVNPRQNFQNDDYHEPPQRSYGERNNYHGRDREDRDGDRGDD